MAQHKRFREVKQGKTETQPHESNISSRNTYTNIPIMAPITTRIKAFITDSFMLLMPIMYSVAYLVMGGLQNFSAHKMQGWLYILIPHFVTVFLFFRKNGQTPGCKAYSILLVDSRSGAQPHPLAIVLRYYFELISIISLFGLLMAFFRKDRKCLHDLLSGTTLIAIPQSK
jgi:uncharacterized RDD family membrane protein YckC